MASHPTFNLFEIYPGVSHCIYKLFHIKINMRQSHLSLFVPKLHHFTWFYGLSLESQTNSDVATNKIIFYTNKKYFKSFFLTHISISYNFILKQNILFFLMRNNQFCDLIFDCCAQ